MKTMRLLLIISVLFFSTNHLFAQCDTVYHYQDGLRITMYYSQTLDAKPDEPNSDLSYRLNKLKEERMEVGRITLPDCASMSEVDRLLEKLASEYKTYKNQKNRKGKSSNLQWIGVTIQYPSSITLKDLIVLLNRHPLRPKVDIDLTSNQIFLTYQL